ncbi:MAG TPA: NAD(P)/FAD-dependent oxidoreductase [Chitinophagaceae bacterium]|jgi:hypothetical protein|nr:NAD(P)/FAD-dependent oxidoreductase [Chitinophagaceae bacterium]
MSRKRLIIIGGGAAGFFCAVNAARLAPQLEVLLLEKSNKLLSKVRISGGGRCNVTHGLFDIGALSRRYPRGQNFVKKSFHEFSATDTIEWFAQRGVQLKTEEDGRMFPVTDDSETIIACLLGEANRHGVRIRMHFEVKALDYREGKFHIEGAGEQLVADFVCVATGGYPKGALFGWLQATGHTIAEPVPSLFTFNLPKHPITALMGVAVSPARVKIEGSKLSEEGPVLITHWGLSGPAVLRLSAWGARELAGKNYQFTAHIHWCPAFGEPELRALFSEARQQHSSTKVQNHNLVRLPARLWQFLLAQAEIGSDQRFADLPSRKENTLLRLLTDYTVQVSGKTTFKEEFVTAGGIQLSEVDARSGMSRKVPHLFFAGEVLDVDGITGGFNFQHAWTSGWIAAKAIAAEIEQ